MPRVVTRLALVAAAAAVAVGVGLRDASPARAIVGGQAISIQQAPWVVYVQYQDGPDSFYRCTGSILDATHVVTAAHCLYTDTGVRAEPDDLLVDAGLSNFFGPTATDAAQSVGVASFRVHPGFRYTGVSGTDDVAVLELATPLDLGGAAAQPVTLPAPGAPLPAGASLQVVGFGRQTAAQSASGPLATSTATAYAQGQCGAFTTSLVVVDDNAANVCFVSPGSAECSGDSGSGAVSGAAHVLVAIVVGSGTGCPVGGATLAADVAAPEVLDFIEGNDTPPAAPHLASSAHYALTSKHPLVAGGSLTCGGVSWTGQPGVTVTYSFVSTKTGRVLQSTARPRLVVPKSAVGSTIRCDVRASNTGGTLVAHTAASAKVAAVSRKTKKKTKKS